MDHLFIINPIAGKGRSLALIPEIKRFFSNRDEKCSIEVTKSPGHATEIVRQYVNNGGYRVYSVGGDGTLNEVLNGMVGSKSSLAVIPAGSGNDFIKSICSFDDLYNLLERTINGREELVDLAKVNNRCFINIASLGFDADVAKNAIKFKKMPMIPGSFAYTLGVLMKLIKYDSKDLQITIDGCTFHTRALLVAVANGRFYGGGIKAAPFAKLDDGKFDIYVVKPISRLKILRFFPKYIKGLHHDIEFVSFYRGKKVEIISDTQTTINFDGELATDSKAVFEVIPKGIRVVVPCDRT